MASSTHQSSHEITTPRLIIRSAKHSDAAGICHVLGNPLNFPHNPVDPDLTLDVFERRIAKWETATAKGDSAFMIVILRETNKIIGFGGFNSLPKAPALTGSDRLELEGDTGLVIDHPFWRKGYATEAFCGTVEYGFDKLGCGHMSMDTSIQNEGWRAFMNHLGLAHVEVRRAEGREGEDFSYKFDKKSWEQAKVGLMSRGKWPL